MNVDSTSASEMTNERRSRERYRIGTLTLDADAFRLDDRGREIAVPKLTFDLFVALLRRAPDVVTIDELMDVVWPNVVVAEDTVTQRVRLLRDALGPEHREIVATVRGRGYRITAPVRPLGPLNSESAGTLGRSTKYYIPAAVFLLAAVIGTALLIKIAEDPIQGKTDTVGTIAVLPFVNMSSDQGDDYFSDGIAEELLNRLARVPHLSVTSRTSSFALRDKGLDARAIAGRLKVRHVLEGSVRRSGNRVRVTAKLIDVESDSYAMSESFERELGDIFAVQDEIAGSVVRTLAGTIETAGAAATLESKRLTRDLDAYELYLEGKYYLHLRGLEPLTKSIALLERAVERDPGFADAHAVLASAYITMPFYTNERTNRYVLSMESSARTALSLDDSIGLAEAVLASVDGMYNWNWSSAEAHFERAISLEPNNSTVWQWYAEFLLRTGQFEEARDAALEGVRLDPVGSSVVNVLGLTLHYLGEDEKALEYAARAREFGYLGGYLSAMVYLRGGQYDLAITAWEDAAPHMGLDTFWVRPYIEALNDPAKTRPALDVIEKARGEGQRTPSGFASEYAALNQIDVAFEMIEEEIARQLFYIPILWEPLNQPLRNDPRFTELLERLRIVEYWQHRGWPAQCVQAGATVRCD